jgi:hypothetical protein
MYGAAWRSMLRSALRMYVLRRALTYGSATAGRGSRPTGMLRASMQPLPGSSLYRSLPSTCGRRELRYWRMSCLSCPSTRPSIRNATAEWGRPMLSCYALSGSSM